MVTIIRDEDTKQGRTITVLMGMTKDIEPVEILKSFTFPFDMDDKEIIKRIRTILEDELKEKEEADKIIEERKEVPRLINTIIEAL